MQRAAAERWVLQIGKPIVFAACLLPFVLLAMDVVTGAIGANPVEAVTHRTGEWALRLLLVTLAVTPLRRVTGQGWLVRFRRMLGLFAFFYASLHLATYLALDRAFAWGTIAEDILARPYITAGLTAFLLLVPLAVTSTRGWVRRLGRRWQHLHRLIYPSAILAVLHYLWLVKADLREPLLYALILLGLLLARLPLSRWLWRRGRCRDA